MKFLVLHYKGLRFAGGFSLTNFELARSALREFFLLMNFGILYVILLSWL